MSHKYLAIIFLIMAIAIFLSILFFLLPALQAPFKNSRTISSKTLNLYENQVSFSITCISNERFFVEGTSYTCTTYYEFNNENEENKFLQLRLSRYIDEEREYIDLEAIRDFSQPLNSMFELKFEQAGNYRIYLSSYAMETNETELHTVPIEDMDRNIRGNKILFVPVVTTDVQESFNNTAIIIAITVIALAFTVLAGVKALFDLIIEAKYDVQRITGPAVSMITANGEKRFYRNGKVKFVPHRKTKKKK